MYFKDLAIYLDKLEKTSARIAITEILADLYKKLTPVEAEKTTYLLSGNLSARFNEIVFNVAEKMILRSIAKAYELSDEAAMEKFKQLGDLGEVAKELAEVSKVHKHKNSLSILELHSRLFAIANDEGEGSQDRKVSDISNLFEELDPLSAKFVARIVIGKLRLGFSDKTILDALSWMETGSKSKKGKLEAAYNVLPDPGLLARMVKEKGIDSAVRDASPIVGVPLSPMLTQRVKSPKEMIEKMHTVFIEPKFDGLRIQIHYKKKGFENGNKIKAFTRSLNEVSWMFPELTLLEKYIKCDEVIFDSEAIGVDEKRKTLANFSDTMSRRRKHDIKLVSDSISMKFYIFDMMFKDDKSYINLPYQERISELDTSIRHNSIFEIVVRTQTTDPQMITDLMTEYKKKGLEGIMIKRADGNYIAGRTGYRWVKMKEEETSVAKLADTIDCVVMGYYVGKGKRNEFGIGGFLVGVLHNEEFVTLSKIGTGINDDQFRDLKTRLTKLESRDKPRMFGEVNKTIQPDFWVDPNLVVEVAADEITKSPIHSSGFALRFPRLVKFRDDKSIGDSTTLEEVNKLFKLQ